jgi:hypothetical protein
VLGGGAGVMDATGHTVEGRLRIFLRIQVGLDANNDL